MSEASHGAAGGMGYGRRMARWSLARSRPPSVGAVQGYLAHKKHRGTSLTRNTGVPRSQETQGYLAHNKHRGTSLIKTEEYLAHKKQSEWWWCGRWDGVWQTYGEMGDKESEVRLYLT